MITLSTANKITTTQGIKKQPALLADCSVLNNKQKNDSYDDEQCTAYE